MQQFRASTPVKVLFAILCVFGLTLAMTLGEQTQWLMDRGAYQSGADPVTAVQEQVGQTLLLSCLEAVEVESYNAATAEIHVVSGIQDPNFWYTVTDNAGRVLAKGGLTETKNRSTTDYRVKQVRTIEVGQGSRVVVPLTVTGYIPRTLTDSGSVIAAALTQAESLASRAGLILTATFTSLALGILSGGMLLWGAGLRRSRTVLIDPLSGIMQDSFLEEKNPSAFDRWIPADVCGVVTLLGLWLALLFHPWNGTDMSLHLGLLLCRIACLSAALACLVSLASQIRTGLWRTHMACLQWERFREWLSQKGLLLRERMSDRKKEKSKANRILLVWAVLIFAVLSIVEGIFLFLLGNFILWIILKVVEIALLLWLTHSLAVLQTQTRLLAEGVWEDPESPIRVAWVFQDQGDDLDQIRRDLRQILSERDRYEELHQELVLRLSRKMSEPLEAILEDVARMRKKAKPSRLDWDTLEEHAASLRQLAGEIEAAAQSDESKINVELAQVDINVLLAQNIGKYQSHLTEKDLTLVLTLAPEGPEIIADAILLHRALDTLMGNIGRYSQPGTRVYLTCQVEGEQVLILLRNISAETLNLPPEVLLARLEEPSHANGLGISRSLVELQHGEFSVQTDGDLFKAVLTFPLCASEPNNNVVAIESEKEKVLTTVS